LSAKRLRHTTIGARYAAERFQRIVSAQPSVVDNIKHSHLPLVGTVANWDAWMEGDA
jgi:hypothetical protein